MEDGRWKMAGGSRYPVLLCLLVAVISVLVVACGGDDDGDKETAAPTAEDRSATPGATEDGTSASPTVPPADTVAPFELDEWVLRAEKSRARPGTVTFEVQNVGDFTHQFLVIRTDIEKDELPRKPNDEGADETDLDIVARIDEIAAGASDEIEVDVEAGQYVLICNLAPGGESHYLNGMYTEFEVTTTAALDSPTPQATP
jgi:uncharacterized cupredoxin-like copper-binding protein